ncbi:MAG: hypothetical protein NC086_00440 [Alistipes sp.]|nr:hypothetical protein [Alistipes sp.]
MTEENIVQALLYLCDSYDIKALPDLNSESVVTIYSGQTVNLVGIEIVDVDVWYKVRTAISDIEYEGYIERDYLLCTNELLIEWEKENISWEYLNKAVLYSSYADIEQFPESYRAYLYELKAAHPNWNFVKFNTNLDWNTVVNNQMYEGRNLVPSSYGEAWKTGRYDNNWSMASRAAVQYYLDPRNYLNETYIFAMEQLTYNATYHNLNGVQNIINGTFMEGEIPGEGIGYAQAFYEIGSEIGVSPYHLASRVKQEQGVAGTSPLISGEYPGFEHLYNYFNIKASGVTNTQIFVNGLTYAREAGWVTRWLALKGGSQFIANSYILRFQDTPYLQKFDVDASYDGLYMHQYMQNIVAPMSEGKTMKNAYTKSNSIDNVFSFKIPVYDNMPDYASPVPGDNANLSGLQMGNDGIWRYYRNGTVAYDFTGMAENEYGWWYITDGEIDWNYTGMASNEYGWWYYRNGQLDWTYTGMACNEYGWWYYRDGQLDWAYTGMACNEYGWWYYRSGQLDWTYTGMACNEYGWWYYRDGQLDWTYTGMAENEYGWWYYQNGNLDWTYTGYASNEYGEWHFTNGVIDWT